jgi:hypothetical protein
MFAIEFTVAVGFTVMVKLLDGPGQETPLLLKVGVTVIVATTGPIPLLTTRKLSISPVPNAGNPMEGALFTQL